jgi:hypothetical protein
MYSNIKVLDEIKDASLKIEESKVVPRPSIITVQ